MAKEIVNPPLVDWSSVLRGFLSGSLMTGGIFNDYGPVVQVALFIIGFLVFLDTVLPSGKFLYAIVTLIFLSVGGIITLYLSLTGQSFHYIAAVVIITVVYYLMRSPGYLEKLKEGYRKT